MTAAILFGVIFALLAFCVLLSPRILGDSARGSRALTFMACVTLSILFLAPR